MTDQEKEMMLDLLVEKFIYGLSEEDSKKLDKLGYDPSEAESIELTVATLGMVDLPANEHMPAHLHDKLMNAVDEVVGAKSKNVEAIDEPEPREIVLSGSGSGSWFGWLGWAAAAAASIALALSLFVPRGDIQVAGGPTPSPTPQQQTLTTAEQKQQLIRAGGEIVRAEWSKGPWKDAPAVTGDVVWSDAEQRGYMTFRGLPVNDPNSEVYQLWIFEDAKLEEFPKDGGVFNVTSDGEVIIPIDAKLRTMDPKAFAVTVEKPGGVVVSKREKIASLAAVKPKDA